MTFTDKIADFIVSSQLDLKHLNIIIPSERAKNYLSASLFKANGKPILAPKMITIDRWIQSLTDKKIIDKTRLLLRLYEIQIRDKVYHIDTSFDEFLSWGPTVLADFDEIDRYLQPAQKVFKNLMEVKEIETWSFGEASDLTEGQKKFMEFWDTLPIYYQKLQTYLNKNNACYMGGAYRNIAENIDLVFKNDKDAHFIFAGFNALSNAELNIFKQLHQMGRAHIMIDADTFYFNNPNHEAGRFLNRLTKALDLKELPFIENNIVNNPKRFHFIECAQVTGQVKVAYTLLSELDKTQLNQTLVLLADESLIVPLLRNLPKSIGKANITLGLPLKRSAVKSWVDLMFSIQENKAKFQTDAIYHRDLQKFWNHPFVVNAIESSSIDKIIQLEKELIRHNNIFKKKESLKVSDVHDLLLALSTTNWQKNWSLAIKTIRQINELIYQNLKETDDFEKALLQGFDQSLVDFENLVIEGLPEMSFRSFKNLFNRHWSQKSVAYYGNPIEGLQIMGLLETRMLDFERIIVLGFNEGNLPPTNPIQTMIPMDLRAYYKLPLPGDKQGLFGHHFYRLLHRAKDITCCYTTTQEAIGSNEASRYMMQIEMELYQKYPNITLEKSIYTLENNENGKNEGEIFKSTETLKAISNYFDKKLSASAMNNYFRCSMDFYFKYILEFREEEKIQEEMESNAFGSIIHEVLEDLYRPFARHDSQGKKVSPAPPNINAFDIDKMLKDFELMVYEKFLIHFDKDSSAFSTGNNKMNFEMAKELTKKFLKTERDFLAAQTEKVFIEYLEIELNTELEISEKDQPKLIKLTGKIDRIDSIGDTYRIIDYKTGHVNDKDVVLNKNQTLLNFFNSSSNPKHVLQLVLYAYLFYKNFGRLPDQTGIFSFIKQKKGLFLLESANYQIKELVDQIPEFIQCFYDELNDVEKPFRHIKNYTSSYCAYCME